MNLFTKLIIYAFFFSTISFFYASWSWCFYFFQLHAIFHFCVSPPPPLRVERVLFYTLNVWLGWNFKIGTKVKKETFFNSQTKKTYIFELQLMQKLQNLCILLFAKESVSAIFFPFIILFVYFFATSAEYTIKISFVLFGKFSLVASSFGKFLN